MVLIPYSPHIVRYRPCVKANYKKIAVNRSISGVNQRSRWPKSPTVIILGALTVGSALYLLWPDHSRSAPTVGNLELSPKHFTPVTITSSECSGPDTKLITLTIPRHSLPSIPLPPIWSVFIKDDEIQVERPYTPLEGIDGEGRISFWIKKYPNGEVGRWLHSKKVGDNIEIRGPLTTWTSGQESWDDIIMISGGTGITPFYQLIHDATLNQPLNGSEKIPRLTLLHSSRTPGELPPPAILVPLRMYAKKNPERFRLHVHVDEKDGSASSIIPDAELQVGRIDEAAIRRSIQSEGRSNWWNKLSIRSKPSPEASWKTLFLVCGPNPMINAIAGPYGRNYSQGPLGGVLSKMGYSSSQVRKL